MLLFYSSLSLTWLALTSQWLLNCYGSSHLTLDIFCCPEICILLLAAGLWSPAEILLLWEKSWENWKWSLHSLYCSRTCLYYLNLYYWIIWVCIIELFKSVLFELFVICCSLFFHVINISPAHSRFLRVGTTPIKSYLNDEHSGME